MGPSGSDMHILLTGKMGYNTFNKPFVLGHECAGIVAKGGSSSSASDCIGMGT